MSLGGAGLGEFELGGGDENEGRMFFVPAFLRITATRASASVTPRGASTTITPHNASLEVTGA